MNMTILATGAILLLALPPALAAPTANGLQGGHNNAGWNNGGGYGADHGRQGDVPLQDLKKHDAYGVAKREGWKLAPGGYRYTPNTEPNSGNPGRGSYGNGNGQDNNGYGNTGRL